MRLLQAADLDLHGLAVVATAPCLLLALLCSGCRDDLALVKPGPLFTSAERAPSGAAVIHLYWPDGREGRRSRVWVQPGDLLGGELWPGTYSSFVVAPGRIEASANAYRGFSPFSASSAHCTRSRSS